jgi:hypothetical protein
MNYDSTRILPSRCPLFKLLGSIMTELKQFPNTSCFAHTGSMALRTHCLFVTWRKRDVMRWMTQLRKGANECTYYAEVDVGSIVTYLRKLGSGIQIVSPIGAIQRNLSRYHSTWKFGANAFRLAAGVARVKFLRFVRARGILGR